ncbi:MAG: SDR family NAD(P)-dependent oxidoreductase [bacterium]|nr:SDR family NAD(P)-dependent oxidoreductase [bacterium]
MNIDGSKILVTGGSLGIGKAAAKLLIESGAHVAITGRDKARVEQAAEEIGAFPITADVARSEDIDHTYEVFMEKFGALDCLVNNAGIGKFTPLDTLSVEDFESVFRVNVFGAAMMAAKAVPIFKEQGKGNIVNIGSTASLKGFETGSVYSASKFALRGLTQCWQAELRKHNVRVFQVNPSEVATAFANEARKEREAASNKLSSVEIAHAIKSILEMDDRGFIPEMSVWATNPW